MSRVFIGIGSNKGQRQRNIERALTHLRNDEDIEIKKVSSIIETEPEGGPLEQKFLNLAIEIETYINPYNLFKRLKNIERMLGRNLDDERWQPREIDLDILLFDDLVIKGKNLKIPHPLMHKRFFVLRPLSQIAPDIRHPIYNKTILELLNELETKNESNSEYRQHEEGFSPGTKQE